MKQEIYPTLHSSYSVNVSTCEADTDLMFGAKNGEREE